MSWLGRLANVLRAGKLEREIRRELEFHAAERADELRASGLSHEEAARRARILELEDKFANPYVAAERGFIDEVIEPSQTRPKLIKALALLENKRDTNPPKKHGNIPL